jgi:hypothetical protein
MFIIVFLKLLLFAGVPRCRLQQFGIDRRTKVCGKSITNAMHPLQKEFEIERDATAGNVTTTIEPDHKFSRSHCES